MIIPGIIALILGAYLVFSPPAYNAFSLGVGLSSQQTMLDRTSVVSLSGSNSSSIMVPLTPQDNLSASIQSNPRGIDFLLMNAGNYSLWSGKNSGSYQVYSQSKLNIGNYSFSFSTKYSDNYYLVFDSPAARNVSTDVLVHILVVRMLTSPEASYVPTIVALLGVVLIALGSITGTKKQDVLEGHEALPSSPPATSARCQFCGTALNPGNIFCPVCKKSQR